MSQNLEQLPESNSIREAFKNAKPQFGGDVFPVESDEEKKQRIAAALESLGTDR